MEFPYRIIRVYSFNFMFSVTYIIFTNPGNTASWFWLSEFPRLIRKGASQDLLSMNHRWIYGFPPDKSSWVQPLITSCWIYGLPPMKSIIYIQLKGQEPRRYHQHINQSQPSIKASTTGGANESSESYAFLCRHLNTLIHRSYYFYSSFLLFRL